LILRRGTYWGIRSHVVDYDVPNALEAPEDLTWTLAETPTRLKELDDHPQEADQVGLRHLRYRP
jgi:NTE family protein